MRSLGIAATGMMAQQLNIDVISNNIANLSTAGYKRQRAEFQDLLYQSQLRVGSNSSDATNIVPAGIQLGLGVKAGTVYRITGQGELRETGSPLDIAVQGRGYFVITTPNGESAYTRAGAFALSGDGEIVTPEGYPVSPGITVPPEATDVSINQSGVVQIKLDGQSQLQTLGQIELVTFVNESGLEAKGNNLFKETPASGTPVSGFPGNDGFGTVLQGYLENSNVDSVKEITTLITAQRAYEMNSKVITASDEMMRTATQIKS